MTVGISESGVPVMVGRAEEEEEERISEESAEERLEDRLEERAEDEAKERTEEEAEERADDGATESTEDEAKERVEEGAKESVDDEATERVEEEARERLAARLLEAIPVAVGNLVSPAETSVAEDGGVEVEELPASRDDGLSRLNELDELGASWDEEEEELLAGASVAVVKELKGVTTGRGGEVPLRERVMALWRDRVEVELGELVDDGASELVDKETSKLLDNGASELADKVGSKLADDGAAKLGEGDAVESDVSEHSDSVSVDADEGAAELRSAVTVDRAVAEGNRDDPEPAAEPVAEGACRGALGPLFQSRRGRRRGPAWTAAARDRV